MRKLVLLVLAASMGSLLTILMLGLPITVSAGAGGPLTDNRFCTDADGNGRLDIGDAVNILNYLFNGTATPHCIAQDVSLDRFATRDDLEALQARLATVEVDVKRRSLVVTGTFMGDGTQGRIFDTGMPGKVRSVQLYGKQAEVTGYIDIAEKTETMQGNLSTGDAGFSIDGNRFILDARFRRADGITVSTALNLPGLLYNWVAHLTEE